MFKKLMLKAGALIMVFALLFSAPVLAQEEDEEYEILPYTTTDFEYDYDQIYTTSIMDEDESALAAGAVALIGGIGLVMVLGIVVSSYIYGGWTLMVIAQKLGDPSPWMAWVPLLNVYLTFKLSGINPWYMLLILVPFVNLFVIVYVMMQISEKRGFPSWLGLLILFPIVNIILPGYLAFAEPGK